MTKIVYFLAVKTTEDTEIFEFTDVVGLLETIWVAQDMGGFELALAYEEA